MPQLHLYLPEEATERVRRRASARGTTISRYLAEVVLREVASDWPEDFFTEVAGKWKGEPLARSSQGEFERREDL